MIEEATGCRLLSDDADAAGLAEMRLAAANNSNRKMFYSSPWARALVPPLCQKGIMAHAELGHMKIRGKDAEHRAGDASASRRSVVEEVGQAVGEVLQVYDATFNPDAIILGGGVSKKFDKFGKYLKHIHARILPAELLTRPVHRRCDGCRRIDHH